MKDQPPGLRLFNTVVALRFARALSGALAQTISLRRNVDSSRFRYSSVTVDLTGCAPSAVLPGYRSDILGDLGIRLKSATRIPALFVRVLLVLVFTLQNRCLSPEPLRFSVRVEDSQGLSAGQPVFHRDIRVGQVTRIQADSSGAIIGVEILPEHRASVYREMQFLIMEDIEEGPVLVLADRGDEKSEIDDGELIDTRPGWLEAWRQHIGKLAGSAQDAVQELGKNLEETVTGLRQSPEARALRESLEEFGRDVGTVARDRYDRLLREDVPKLELKAQAYRDRLKREGREAEAEIFWKWFSRWVDALKTASQEAQEEQELKAEEEPGDPSN